MVLVSSRYDILKRGERAIDFALQGIDGKIYSLANFSKANALLIIFMCNHCPYVKPKMDYFVELQKHYSPGLQVVGINPNDPTDYPEDNLDGMKQTAREQEFNFPYLIDEKQKIAIEYGAICTPDPYLFNEKHELSYHGRFDDAHKLSHNEAKTSELEDAIKQVLAEKEVTVPTMPSMGCSIKWSKGNEPKYYLDAVSNK